MIATERFAELARQAAEGYGLPEARVATVPHPIGGTSSRALERWASAVADEVVALLTGK